MSQRASIVTGGSGFIGSHLVRQLLQAGHRVLNIDKLTYAGNPENLADVAGHPDYAFFQADVADGGAMTLAVEKFQPDFIFHLAAESHVDRSISAPAEFLHTNVLGTAALLQAARVYQQPEHFRFIHVSTDEVYGELGHTGSFTETTPYDPRSPYSASKAASDHLVRAWHHTYGLPVIITHCTNNYGTHQYPEKLIPLVIDRAKNRLPVPVYGKGEQVRDWIHVSDHCSALLLIAESGGVGETYNIGANDEWRNLDLVRLIVSTIAELEGLPSSALDHLITFVTDRPGHDFRYSLDAEKLRHELGWRPRHALSQDLAETARWYLA